VATPMQCGWALGHSYSSAAGAGPFSLLCMPMGGTWGAAGSVEGTRDPRSRPHRRWPADAVELDCLALLRCRIAAHF
jgi:hypothetical protein